MPLEPAITDMELLKDRVAIACLLAGLPGALLAAKFDRNELTLIVDQVQIVEALRLLRDSAETQFNALADVTSVDLYPAEPRFEVIYSLISYARRERIRVKVPISGLDPYVESVTPLWMGASPFEREIFDLMGIRFQNHPDLRRILMPDEWEGHPLRKDYPVEGYR
jgi:NADH-quinone oxidoreductase subunit C